MLPGGAAFVCGQCGGHSGHCPRWRGAGCAGSTCCRVASHDLPNHKLEFGKSPIVRNRLSVKAFVRAVAAMRYRLSYARELCAVEMLRLAGYRPAVAWVRAYWAAGCCGSVVMSCVRFTPAVCRVSAKQDGLRNVPFLFRRSTKGRGVTENGVGGRAECAFAQSHWP